ncbi:S16 family serine protease [Proteinivorax hydrogeniformans]|uniref:S16 family serine protease n=1 Tax=Proteinivorax hydrogeniformans TaxID=1826727 RepID=A0AAU8HQW2_9FIRM
MNFNARKLQTIAIALALLLMVFLFIGYDTGYLVVRPGDAILIGDMVEIENSYGHDSSVYLLTVSQFTASPLAYLLGVFSPRMDLMHHSVVIPPDMDMEEYYKLNRQRMQESQDNAKVVALQQAGYDVPMTSDGVEIVDILPTSTVKEVLQVGDIFKVLDGEKVMLSDQLISIVQSKNVGDEITTTIVRNEVEKELALKVGRSESDPKVPALGVFIQTLNWEPVYPIDISFDTGQIGGPSAGMMFVLEIYNQLTEEDIIGDLVVAGTGTINFDGSVGAIGGMKQKVYAAENKQADVLFCPIENYEEAIAYATEVEVVKVNHFDDIVNFLNENK